jgi:hypothetical protein
MTLLEVVGPNALPEILEIELCQTGFKSENGSLNRQFSATTRRNDLLFGGWHLVGPESISPKSGVVFPRGRKDGF